MRLMVAPSAAVIDPMYERGGTDGDCRTERGSGTDIG
jgi:hypothetical protein